MMRRAAGLARRMIGQPEFWSSVAVVLWSRWLTFDPKSLAENDTYHVLTRVVDEAYLEWIALAVGVAQFLAVLANKRWPRFGAAFIAAAFWLTLANAVTLATRNAPGASTSLTLALMNMALMLLLCCPRRVR